MLSLIRSPRLIFFTLLLLSIFSYVIYWIDKNFTINCVEIEMGLQGEAYDNPLLAAQRLLERMGTPVTMVKSLTDLEELDIQDTLILWNHQLPLTEEQSQLLFNWVDEGGHLIIASNLVNEPDNQTDPLLRELKVYRFEDRLEHLPNNQAFPTTQFTWETDSLEVAFDPHYWLESAYDPVIEITDDYGNHLLFYYYGTGMISILSDMQFIRNERIGQYDHAQFFWLLVHLERPANQVWILRSLADLNNQANSTANIPSLGQLIWQQMWTVVITVSILLLFWLWFAIQRFGPLIPEPNQTRRRLLEHIEASGHFLWRYRQVEHLLHRARQAVFNQLESVHPDWVGLSPTALSQRLTAQCEELSAEEIEAALYTAQPQTEFAFTQTIRILTQIRKTL